MQLDDSLATSAASAAVSGDMQDFGLTLDYIVRKAGIDAATAGGGADVHVQLEHLATFYNALSGLHTQLLQEIEMVQSTAGALKSMNAGGKVPGVQKAWTAMAQSAGVLNSPTSLVMNLQAVDGMVLQHMDALHHNAQQYAQQENLAISTLGRAAGTGDAGPTTAARPAHPDSGSKISDTTGVGGK